MADAGSLIETSCPARAALAGNPSDGYGGAVAALPIHARRATVTLRPDARFRFTGTDDEMVLDSWDDVARHAEAATPESPHALALATTHLLGDTRGFALDVSTTIPRSVGLAGSSAIVIATLRALMLHRADHTPPCDVLAAMALRVEVVGLGIAAGLQDRVVQAYEHPMFMRFDAPSMRRSNGWTAGDYRRLDGQTPVRCFVATLAAISEPSQIVHRDLRSRHLAGDEQVATAMIELAHLAGEAADAFECGDVDVLGASMNTTFDIRRTLVDVAPELDLMIDTARSAGAAANSTGSGGSIVVLAPNQTCELAARTALAGLGCDLIEIG